jgi:2-dehydro-3-deoxyphosphooctonate aldolase (KDO 8-P synthase)
MRKSTLWKSLTHSRRLSLIAGPCVIENEEICMQIADFLKKICMKLGVTYIFKASFDKANRTSIHSFRGPGLETGLNILAKIRDRYELPILTDIHSIEQADIVHQVVDIIQIPAFLCRQTDLIASAVNTGCIVNLKKGQFLSPKEMGQVVAKAEEMGGKRILITERGTTFGYNNLVVDMRSIPVMKQWGYPIIFDATHSVQLPGAGGDKSSGQSEFAPVLARSAVAAGVDGLFIETHPEPQKALSDGPNMIPLKHLPKLLAALIRLKNAL